MREEGKRGFLATELTADTWLAWNQCDCSLCAERSIYANPHRIQLRRISVSEYKEIITHDIILQSTNTKMLLRYNSKFKLLALSTLIHYELLKKFKIFQLKNVCSSWWNTDVLSFTMITNTIKTNDFSSLKIIVLMLRIIYNYFIIHMLYVLYIFNNNNVNWLSLVCIQIFI